MNNLCLNNIITLYFRVRKGIVKISKCAQSLAFSEYTQFRAETDNRFLLVCFYVWNVCVYRRVRQSQCTVQCVYSVYCVCIVCVLCVYCVYVLCVYSVCIVCTVCVLCVYCVTCVYCVCIVCVLCALCVYCVCTVCVLCVYSVCIVCTYMFDLVVLPTLPTVPLTLPLWQGLYLMQAVTTWEITVTHTH